MVAASCLMVTRSNLMATASCLMVAASCLILPRSNLIVAALCLMVRDLAAARACSVRCPQRRSDP